MMRLALGLFVLLGGLGFAQVTRAEEKGTPVEFDGMTSLAPASWKAGKPKSQMRLIEFVVPRAEGDPADGEIAVFKGIGGSAQANIDRWKAQFQAPEGKKIDDVAKVTEFKVNGHPVMYLDVSGSYLERFPPFDPNAKITKRPEYRMLAFHFDGPRTVYHVKFIGPAKTVEKYRAGFESWLKSFK